MCSLTTYIYIYIYISNYVPIYLLTQIYKIPGRGGAARGRAVAGGPAPTYCYVHILHTLHIVWLIAMLVKTLTLVNNRSAIKRDCFVGFLKINAF